jgi:hypothetical protein
MDSMMIHTKKLKMPLEEKHLYVYRQKRFYVIDGKRRLNNRGMYFRSIHAVLLFLCRIAHIFLAVGF